MTTLETEAQTYERLTAATAIKDAVPSDSADLRFKHGNFGIIDTQPVMERGEEND